MGLFEIFVKDDGFWGRWRSWMESLMFNTTVSILVNGSPTKDFAVTKGLRQGDPISPFLFLFMAEGLSALMRKASCLGECVGFKAEEDLHFKMLHDTLLISDGSWNKLWSVKIILKGFELVSGLRASKVAIKEIIKLQMVFLWRETKDKKKVDWIGWDKVCLPNKDGGYGDIRRVMLSVSVTRRRNKVSLWWKDLCPFGSGGTSLLENWFPSSISCKLGYGDGLDVWLDRRLGCSWEWRINFREGFVDDEDGERVENLVTSLGGSKPTVGIADSYFWWKNSTGFSVKATYDMILEGSYRVHRLEVEELLNWLVSPVLWWTLDGFLGWIFVGVFGVVGMRFS
ncbi:uncharacterized protein LOC131623913 [Vicia villosa]|uniref:uncharacterized protein LOC131623913 n=1 Tax=Vicia villosa TaxID=3911 RepID=UPI00273AB773|nr:uncharacterized protein LOC131623913 [Vicia villosa]